MPIPKKTIRKPIAKKPIAKKPLNKSYVIKHAKVQRMWHPDQKVYIVPLEPVELKLDSWTEVQLKAGLIMEA